MIRPISDERGFEVVGHFRYGRGIHLRDGSLVLTDTGVNARADVGVQLALSGNLTSALIAQSQGLTTVISAYPNPAETVSTLTPEDLQTGATKLPEQGAKEAYSAANDNFVSTAPLGSAEQQGLPPNVEAAQLSHALTLAEMNVRTDDDDATPCACLFSRPELAFMNVGYQVKTLIGTAPDGTDTPAGPAGLESISVGNEEYQNALDEGRPVSAAAFPQTSQAMMSKVDSFLFQLYSVFDTSHQEYEQAIRGTKLPSGTEGDLNPENIRFGEPAGQYGPLDPPYSAPNRYQAGDPEAALKQYSSARADLKQQWEDFGDNLQANAKKAKLDQEIANLRRDIANLQAALASAEAAVESGTGSQAEVERLMEALADKTKQLQDKLLERSVLENEYPAEPTGTIQQE
jgi:hypothetical protein